MESTTLLLAITLLIAIAAIGLAVALQGTLRAERKRIATLQNDLRALCGAAVNVGERIGQLERQQRRLALRQDQMGLEQNQGDGDVRSFDQAAKMVRNGAGVEEIMEICGISRGEAELVAMMQRLEK